MPSTINRELACLKNLYNKAILWDWGVNDNPVKRVDMLPENNARDRMLSHEEIGAAVADSAVHVLIAVGEGARPIAEAALRFGMAEDSVHPVEDAAAAIEWLETELRPGDWMLCKASRGVGLDRVVDSLVAGLQARLSE